MHLAVDVNDLHRPQSGIGRYICGLLTGFEEVAHNLELSLIHKDPLHPELAPTALRPRVALERVPGRSETWWGQVSLPRAASRAGAHVLLCPAVRAPVLHRVPVVLTVHDVIFLAHPEYYTAFDRRYMRGLYALALPRVDQVITVSEATKRDLSSFFNLDERRVTVIHHGIEDRFRPRDPARARTMLQEMGLQLPERVILSVGTLEPRKNLRRLVDAVEMLRSRGFPHVLVVAGKPGWLDEGVLATVSRGKEKRYVQHLGYVPDPALPLLYNAADVLAYASLYEGFGFPVLEAMASGTPAVTSVAPGVSEVAGDATLSVDPRSTEDLARALERAIDDADVREHLRDSGLRRARGFRWSDTAQRTLQVCRAAADGGQVSLADFPTTG